MSISSFTRLAVLSGFRPLCSPLILTRGKKKSAQKKKKSKKDFQREEQKNRMKQLELEKQLEQAVLKVAKQGEPMDPEMLNPARKRPLPKLTEDERDQEFLLVKEWSRYTMKKHIQDLKQLEEMKRARNKALNELRKVSSPLYIKALETRTDLFPFERIGPMATPPLVGYQPPELDDSP